MRTAKGKGRADISNFEPSKDMDKSLDRWLSVLWHIFSIAVG